MKRSMFWIGALLVGCAFAATAQEATPPAVAVPVAELETTAAGEATTLATAAAEGLSSESPARDAFNREMAAAFEHVARLRAVAEAQNARREELHGAEVVQMERFAVLSEGLRDVEPESAAADEIYASIVDALRLERLRLRRVLDALGAGSEVPSWSPSIKVEVYGARGLTTEVDTLQAVVDDIESTTESLRNSESELRWAEVEQAGRTVSELNQLRLDALDRLTPERRRRLLGTTREGVAQLRRELDQLVLDARLYRHSRIREVGSWRAVVRDVFTIGTITWSLLKLLMIVLLTWWLALRWRDLLISARKSLTRSRRSLRFKRRATAWFEAFEHVVPWFLVLVVVFGLRWALGVAADRPIVRVPLTIVTYYACYRLTIDVFVRVFLGIASHYHLRLAERRRELLIGSVRWMMRILAAIAILLTVSEQAMGRGYLFHLVVNFSWVAIVLTLWLILMVWRPVMVDTFLELQPSGRLSRLVSSSRDRWYGMLVAPAAFVWLAGRGIVVVARDFALGFEQTGKVLAYMFRRKVEKQAETRGYATSTLEELPPEILAAFSEEAVERGDLVLPHFPGLDRLRSDVTEWRKGGFAGSFLLTGERGIGKTSWLNQVLRDDLEVLRLELKHRVYTPLELTGFLAAEFALPKAAGRSLEKLASALAEAGPRLVIVDLAQHLFLASVGGYTTFAAFAELVNRTRRQVYWLCSMNAYGWRHLKAVRADATVFRSRCHLPSWGEQEIRELIQRRCEASGARFNFADLVVDQMEGISFRSSVVESEEGYTRLLWDYSDGNPRSALHHFVRSLEVERGDRVRVRMFRAPDVDRLEDGGEPGMFLLAAIVTHESIGIDDLTAVTRYRLQDCHIHLDRLRDLGAICEEDGMFRIATQWHRAIVRLLRRRNYIPD